MSQKVQTQTIHKLFWDIILPFYQIERDMPLPIKSLRAENDAEHSWSLALAASCLAPILDPKLDVGKVCMFAVVHDVVEVYAGDVSVWGTPEELAKKEENEAKALKKIKDDFRELPWLAKTIEEYEHKDTPEAMFVYSLDKFIAWLTRFHGGAKYFKDNKITIQMFRAQMDVQRPKAHKHPAVAPYFDEIAELFLANPDFFHKA